MKYRLIDDPLCDLDENIPCCENCEECEYFLDCMEEYTEEEYDEYIEDCGYEIEESEEEE